MQQGEHAALSQIQVVCAMDTAAKSRMSNETALVLTNVSRNHIIWKIALKSYYYIITVCLAVIPLACLHQMRNEKPKGSDDQSASFAGIAILSGFPE